MIQPFRFTAHALEEMAERQITEGIVLSVIKNPQQIVPNFGERKCYQSKIKMGNKDYLIRVIVDEQANPFTVVTAYRTSKIEKYWSTL
jgi:hypothetical protein